MRAAGGGGNQVDIAFAHGRAQLGKGQAPGGAFAFAEGVAVLVGISFAFEQRDDGVGIQRLREVVLQATLVLPLLNVFVLFIGQRHAHTGHEHGLGAQQVHQLMHGQVGAVKVFGIWPHTHRGAVLAVAAGHVAGGQGFNHITASKGQRSDLTVAVHRHFQARGQSVRHRDAHAVQTAGEAVRAAIAFVELAASVQACKDQLHHGSVFFRVQAKGNAAAIVFHTDGAVAVQCDLDFFTVSGQCFVRRVVDHLLHDVQGVVGAGVHAGALLDGLQALENTD